MYARELVHPVITINYFQNGADRETRTYTRNGRVATGSKRSSATDEIATL